MRVEGMARRPETTTTSLTAMTTGGIRGVKGSWLAMMETEVEAVGEAGLRW